MLITDNAPTHIVARATEQQEHGHRVFYLSNIKVVFLPPNVTSHAQPLDQGIIASFKAHYRRELVQWMLDEANKDGNELKSLKDLAPNFFQMLQWVHIAWTQKVSSATIRNCWRKSGLLPADDCEVHQDLDGQEELCAAIQGLQDIAHNTGILSSEEQLIDASQYVQLDGEDECVHDELEDDDIVALLKSQDVHVIDSDEDSSDEAIQCTTTSHQASSLAVQLHEYMLSKPHMFSVEMLSSMASISRHVQFQHQQNVVQSSIGDYFTLL